MEPAEEDVRPPDVDRDRHLPRVVGGTQLDPDASVETLLIRGVGTAALLLLHVILCIGPLARLDSRFLPLLYNRRHMGVTMFVLAAGHGVFSLLYFHAFGDVNPLVSVLASNPRWDSVAHFPFQPLGFLALLILFLMAATSHDFWLANLTAPTWKALHLLVYVAYGLIVMHVVLGVLQAETSPVLALVLGLGVVTVLGLHLKAGFLDRRRDEPVELQPWMSICSVDDIEDGRGNVRARGDGPTRAHRGAGCGWGSSRVRGGRRAIRGAAGRARGGGRVGESRRRQTSLGIRSGCRAISRRGARCAAS